MNPRECPRCNEVRLGEWFGDPKAPYAICLSCRVELNGEKVKPKPKRMFSRNCAICTKALETAGEICLKCEGGLKAFDGSAKRVARAASFLSGHLRRSKKKFRKVKRQNRKLNELVRQQKADQRDNRLRFEHALSK